jgi:hypothetical protein
MHTHVHSAEAIMGRANVYLPDGLERRVRAANIPISEVCQRALLAAVEAAERGGSRFSDAVREQMQRGREAGEAWAAGAPPEQLLALARDQHFDEIPPDTLPTDLYSLTAEQSLGWEAGFSAAARAGATAVVASGVASGVGESASGVGESASGVGESASGVEESASAQSEPAAPVPLAKSDPQQPGADSGLGDDSGCHIGLTVDGAPVSFDPHTAVRAGKSSLFAILGQDDLRARLTLSLAQDAAARGTAVVLLDVSGQLSARARGLGKNVRIVRPPQPSLPALDDLAKGAIGLGGLMEMLSGLSAGSGLSGLFSSASQQLPPAGHITVVDIAGDGGLASALSLAQAAHLLSQLATSADHPRLVHIDLPGTASVPAPLAARLNPLIRFARERNTALGLSAPTGDVITNLTGSAAPLSTVFAFATGNPIEADRLRDLLGPGAPVLVNPPGLVASADDPTWVVMRDVHGRLGQVRLDAW